MGKHTPLIMHFLSMGKNIRNNETHLWMCLHCVTWSCVPSEEIVIPKWQGIWMKLARVRKEPAMVSKKTQQFPLVNIAQLEVFESKTKKKVDSFIHHIMKYFI